MYKLLASLAVAALAAIAALLAVSLLSAGAAPGQRVQSAADPAVMALMPTPGSQTPGINVDGEGSVKAQPDVAYVTAGVQNQASTAQAAQQENARVMTAVVGKLQSMGYTTQKDLRTVGLSIRPIYDRQSQTPTGYQATNQVIVTVSDINQAGATFDAMVGAGANTAGDIRFSLKDDTALRTQALREAIKSARTKADAIAAELGVRITGVDAVSEQGISSPVVPMDRVAAAAPAGPSTPVIPGELTVTAHVRVVYRY